MPEENDQQARLKAKKGRSPAYPSFDVEKALEKADQLLKQEGEYAVPVSSVTSAWGYSPKSSSGRQAIATLKYYGLIEITGDGDTRKAQVTDIARRILLDEREDDTEKRQLIKKVALTPNVHKALFNEYPAGLASDATVNHFLVFDEKFNKDAADEVISEFKQTVIFSELYEQYGSLGDGSNREINCEDESQTPDLKVGNKIQWTNSGVDMFKEPATVIGFSDDGEWVYTNNGKTAVNIKEVTVLEQSNPAKEVRNPPVNPPAHIAALMASNSMSSSEVQVNEGYRKAVFPVEDGDVTLIFPEYISQDGIEELGQYLNIFLKKEQKNKRVLK